MRAEFRFGAIVLCWAEDGPVLEFRLMRRHPELAKDLVRSGYLLSRNCGDAREMLQD
jgi:hypothetical protein